MENKKLKALGFVEIMIALVVVGIASAVFLTISSKSMKNLIQNERMEYMARIASDGANMAQEIANQEKADLMGPDDYFPSEFSLDKGRCFIPLREQEGEDVSYFFKTDESGTFESVLKESAERRNFFVEHAQDYYDGYFLVMCINDMDDTGTKWANVEFRVGDVKVAGEMTTDSDLKDFIYYAIIDL